MTYRELKAYGKADEDELKRLDEFFASIPDPQTRQMFELRYKYKLKYQQIALHLGGGMTASCVRMRIARHMDSLYR